MSQLTDAQKWIIGGVTAVVVLLLAAAVVLAGGDDDDTATTTTTEATSTTTTEATTTTSEASTTTTTTFSPAVDAYEVAFPSPEASRSFESAESAARAYATDVLGFTELALGAAAATGEGTAEVVIQDREDGPESAIELVEADGGAWYVVGSTTPDVVVSQPAPATSLATPFETAGEALAFEGNVEVVVVSQLDGTVLGSGAVTGSGSPPPGPFNGRIEYEAPAEATPGILVYRVRSAEDGRVTHATSIRVRLTALRS